MIINTKSKAKFEDKIHVIFDILKSSQSNHSTLMSGNSGKAMFMFYYAMEFQNEDALKIGGELISQDLDNLNIPHFSLAGGNTGTLWVINHLIENDFIEMDEGDLESFHKTLIEKIFQLLKLGQFDYLHGALGITFYLLEYKKFPQKKEVFEQVVDKLDEIAIKDERGIRWKSTVDMENPKDVFNFSLSHGMTSIIAILGKIFAKGIRQEKCKNLIDGCIQFMVSFKNEESRNSKFPSYVPVDLSNKYLKDSKVAWCYGDLGMGLALYVTAINIKDKVLEKFSIDILRHTAKRRGMHENQVHDAMFCHGASGNGHLFHRAYLHTGIEEFKEASLYWFEETLALAQNTKENAGFKTFKGEKNGGWVNETGLLEGIAGVGLALMAAISEHEPKWDSCFLIS